jgi:hypothetical protein
VRVPHPHPAAESASDGSVEGVEEGETFLLFLFRVRLITILPHESESDFQVINSTVSSSSLIHGAVFLISAAYRSPYKAAWGCCLDTEGWCTDAIAFWTTAGVEC